MCRSDMGGKRTKKKHVQVRSIVTRSSSLAASRLAPAAAPVDQPQEEDVAEEDVSLQGGATEESVRDDNSTKKQVQVRTIVSCSCSPAASRLASTAPVDDPQEEDVSHQGGATEESGKNDGLSRVPMKGGCGKICRHVERGVTVDRLATQVAKSKATLTQCLDCIKEGKDATSKKSKARSARKKVAHNTSVQNGSHEGKKWVCLACGHVGCSRISTTTQAHWGEFENEAENEVEEGAPTAGHAWKHSVLAKHPVALQSGDNLVCWCFTCNAPVDSYSSRSASSEVNSKVEESRGPLQQAIKIVCDKLVKEGVFFKNPGKIAHIPEPVKAVIDALPHPSPIDTSIPRPLLNGHYSGSQRKRVVRGLMNLGNTCFFNSVIQNLLALDLLRNYFSQDSQVAEAPLTSSLRRLYLETNTDGPASKASGHVDVSGFDSGLKRGGKGRAAWESTAGAYNPRSLFGAICAKAPRFRGFQQQDSHELLRCLLEGLSSEEQSTRVTEAESRKVTSFAKSTASKQPSRGDDLESLEEQIETGDAEKPTAASQIPTFVDNFFGGQLSSTVCCCECGHSSVVYEPILDLSLQIPSRHAFKKGQARAESSLVGRPENAPLCTGVNSSGAVNRVDIPEAPRACSLVVTESKQVSSGIFSSPSASEIGNTSKVSPNYSTSLDDFGWLDFLGGGIQSAEGSLQGSHDVINSVQNSDNVLVDNTECSVQGNLLMKVPQPLSNEKSSSLLLTDGLKLGNREGSDESVGTAHIVPTLPPESSGTEGHLNGVVDAGQALEDEELVAQPGEDDGPLPLASGILLLPYEPLQLPSDLTAEERVDRTDTARSAVDESLSSLQGEEEETALSLQVEDNGGDFVGVSQLFEEDESLTAEDHSGQVRGKMDDSQITEDNSWDAGSGAFLGEESDLIAVGSRKLVDHQDAIVPMSVEGCLAEFTKSELLSGDNAWECENCSRRIKETAPPLASSNEGNAPICYKGGTYSGGGEKLGKAESERQSKDVQNPAEEGVSSSSDYVNGKFSHVVYSNHSAVSCKPKKIQLSSISLEDGLNSEALSGSWSHASSNGNMDDNTSKFKSGDVGIGKVEAHARIGNGSARLNHLDSDQVSLNQSPLCQRDDEENTYFGQGNCMERLQDFPPKESGCVERRTGEDGERPHYTDKDQDGIDKSVQKRKPFSAQISGKRHVFMDFAGPGDVAFGTSSRDDKLHGPFRISGRPLRSQKSKTRKTHLENETVLKMDATKRLLISKAPPVLTIHLKRFAQDMCGRLNKLSGHVAFPEVLDLRPFLDARCPDSEDCIYRLVGVVEHAGTMRGGHYIAYVRGPPSDVRNQESDSMHHDNKSSWYYISDSSVHKSSLQAVLNSEAYLLFYEKCEAT